MAIVLIFASFLFAIAILYLRENQFRLAFIKACIIHGCLIIFSTELLSLTRSLDFTHVASFWLITSLVNFSVLWNCYRKLPANRTFKLKSNFETLDRASQISIAVTIAVLLISLITALIAPPNNWDSMTYHMPRVMHWIQNRTVAHYPTHSLRQISFPPGAAYIVTHLQILAGGDRFANCVQWLSFVGSIFGISLLTKKLVGEQAQWISLVLCASIPMAIAQSTTTQTDLVTSFWLVCFTYFLFASPDFKSNLFWMIGSLGLALVTKPTAIIFGIPLFVVFGFLTFRRSFIQNSSVIKSCLNTVKVCSIVGLGSLTFPIWSWLRNAQTLNQFLGTDMGTRSEVNSLPELISIFLKNLSLNLTLPGLRQFITLIHEYFLKVDVNKPALTLGNPVVAFSTIRTSPLNLLFPMEDSVANPIHLILGVVAVSYLWSSYFRRADQKLRLLLLSGAIATGYLLYCYLLKWQPWGNRLLLPLFILQTPIISYYLADCLKIRSNLSVKLTSLIGVVAILYALTPIRHPLVPLPNWSPYLAQGQSESILWLPRQQIYFGGSLKYLEITDRKIVDTVIDRDHCHTIGLISGEDDWEYPLWVLFNEKTSGNFRLKHVDVKNESAKLEPEFPDSELCAIVSTKGHIQSIP
ncbi:hypothetical protein C7B65_23505 [Phormidesmis priestleyi ULC007]|uniref:Glycosyltransferase RgtA/B/C/D-like domain-containing protein n=1 Tax=Phormidesmis priestleyi ULC007 TaxID=1920490 RepID=A0A2T1D5K0_9CYAN|nr:glycosyltransferase family 39 protein [Phormidesmis priestleyi]PSB15783.1 hypothetical protein C7B65_23505 [Phormidesmis priestleyi ULC007]PZO46804.1 MAG: hypothetical protein DCF14_21645 [Phormidesmis priestleyi]